MKMVNQAKYLGVITALLTYTGSLTKAKANRTLGFLKRNLKNAPNEVSKNCL